MKSVLLLTFLSSGRKLKNIEGSMKGLLLILLLTFSFLSRGQGTSCGTAILLNLNGVISSYPTAANTGNAVFCSNNTTTSPVTWFRFSTNAAAECPLINITTSDLQACEVAFYTACNGQNMEYYSSMCFADGAGVWAPSETFLLSPSTTYYLRVKTNSAGTISIGGQHHAPSNNSCLGATSITTATITDNNSCHSPGTEVTPQQLCAATLENTAYYKFIIASQGSAIMNISDISCDNGNGNNNSGFQIGFFTGDCGALVPLNCTSGSGSFVQATTSPLPAGSQVFVAIDGMSGSNCTYSITGINVYGVLANNFKKFSGWKKSDRNVITWTCVADNGKLYSIERSANGKDFYSIGQLNGKASTSLETTYSFDDTQPVLSSWYRIRQINQQNAISISHTIHVVREEKNFDYNLAMPFNNQLEVKIRSKAEGKLSLTLFTISGSNLQNRYLKYHAGVTSYSINMNMLPAGKYFIRIDNGIDAPKIRTFIKPQ